MYIFTLRSILITNINLFTHIFDVIPTPMTCRCSCGFGSHCQRDTVKSFPYPRPKLNRDGSVILTSFMASRKCVRMDNFAFEQPWWVAVKHPPTRPHFLLISFFVLSQTWQKIPIITCVLFIFSVSFDMHVPLHLLILTLYKVQKCLVSFLIMISDSVFLLHVFHHILFPYLYM